MLAPSFILLFALLCTLATGQYPLNSLTCYPPSSSYLTATSSATPHGSLGQGSVLPSATRCPRAKPTVTNTIFVPTDTVFVPTRPGFTPISVSNQASTFGPSHSDFISISLGDDRVAYTTSGNNRPQSVRCDSEPTPTSTETVLPSTCPVLSTVTTATTIATSRANIVYDACGDDNFAFNGYVPPALNKDPNMVGLRTLKLYNVTSYSSPYLYFNNIECCNACQELNCAYGRFSFSREDYVFNCELYFQDVCNGKEWLGSVYSTGPYLRPGARPFDGFQVFNGPCGRIIDAGPEF